MGSKLHWAPLIKILDPPLYLEVLKVEDGLRCRDTVLLQVVIETGSRRSVRTHSTVGDQT